MVAAADDAHRLVDAALLLASSSAAPPPGVAVEDLSRSHRVVAVRGDDGGVVVKIAGAGRAGPGRDLGIEVAALRLAGTDPRLAAVVPRLLLADRQRRLLVTDAVPGVPASALLLDAEGQPDAAVAGMLGEAAGQWHAAAAGRPFPAACRPWPLVASLEPGAAADGAAGGIVAAVVRAGPIRTALRELAETWTAATVVHGDLKADNALVVDGTRAVLVDWELAGAGDAAWDLGCLIGELHAVAQGPAVDRAVAACAAAHAVASGAVRRSDWGERVARAVVGKLVCLAFERAVDDDRVDGPAAGLLAMAARLAAGLAPLASALERSVA